MVSWPIVRCNRKEICEVLRVIIQSKGEIFNKVYYHSTSCYFILELLSYLYREMLLFFFTYFMLLYHPHSERQWDPMLIIFKWTCKHLLVNTSKSRETHSKIRKPKAWKWHPYHRCMKTNTSANYTKYVLAIILIESPTMNKVFFVIVLETKNKEKLR